MVTLTDSDAMSPKPPGAKHYTDQYKVVAHPKLILYCSIIWRLLSIVSGKNYSTAVILIEEIRYVCVRVCVCVHYASIILGILGDEKHKA